MHANVLISEDQNDRFGQGMAGAIVLHLLLVGAIAAFAVWGHFHTTSMGDKTDLQGAIQASMVSAIPLPTKQQPVEQQVLAPEDTSAAAVTPPKEATAPPPKPTDIQVKAKTPEKPVKVAPVQQPTPPKHPQPTQDTSKAQMGQEATQLAQSTTPVGTGSATATILDKVAGQRYSYYAGIISGKVAKNWYKGEADPRTSLDRTATILFDVDTDGTPENIRIEVRSGSPTLDQSALRAVQRIETFGPSPMGHTITVEFKFLYATP